MKEEIDRVFGTVYEYNTNDFKTAATLLGCNTYARMYYITKYRAVICYANGVYRAAITFDNIITAKSLAALKVKLDLL